MKSKKLNTGCKEILSILNHPSLPSSFCGVVAPCSDCKSFSYASGDLVCVPVELNHLVKSSVISRMFPSLLAAYNVPLSFSCDFYRVPIVRRFFDMTNYRHIVACYDIKLPDSTYLFSVPEFLLFPDLASLSSSLAGCYLFYSSAYIYLVSPVFSPSLGSSDSSSLFDTSVPPIDTSISKDFSLFEFLRSDHCLTSELYSSLTRSHYDNIVRLVEMVLQPARSELHCPIFVSSGFRTPEVNKAVGGASRSLHLLGRAADVYVPSSCASNNRDLYYILCVLPHVELKRYSSFIHIAL